MDTLLQVAASWILPALFFWFLFSLIAMTLIEGYQRYKGSRQKGLEEIIEKLMGPKLKDKFYEHAIANPLDKIKPAYISDNLVAKVMLDWILPQPTVETLGQTPEKNAVHKSMQMNINSLAEINKEFGIVLRAIVAQANMKTEKLSEFVQAVEKDLEAWFLEGVKQMVPVYGRRLQILTLGMSLLVAFVANFDVINITVRLWETSKYPELLDIAEKTEQQLQLNTSQITTLPVGWYAINIPDTLVGWFLKIIGLYLGAYFIALGSQYVYNLTRRQYRPTG